MIGDSSLTLCLIFKQEEGEEKLAFALPRTDKFTIGRYGDVVPNVGGSALSRIHATVTREDDRWIVDDGGLIGNTARRSSNGIFDANGDRVAQITLASAGDYADLLPPQDGLTARIVCEAECDRSHLYSRDTGDFDDYWRQQTLKEIAEIRAHQERQEALFSQFTEQFKAFTDQVKKKDRRQDALIKGLAVAVVAMAIGLVVDPSKRDGYLDSVIKIALAGAAGTATMAISQNHPKSGEH